MPDRTKQPDIKSLENIQLLNYQTLQLSNGIPVILFKGGDEEATKIDINFYAGSWQQPLPIIAPSVARLLKSGTQQRTAHQIASEIDFYGASLASVASRDMSMVSMLSLNTYLEEMINIMEDLIKNPTFPGEEIEVYRRNQLQRLQVNEQKVNYLAKTRFVHSLFGEEHPYGKYLREEYFENLTRENLQQFHKDFYNSANCYILLSGKVPEKTLKIIDKHFGGSDWAGNPAPEKTHKIESAVPGNYHIAKDGAVQKAIRMGKILFDRTHPDYPAMKIVNTILGGYFGSRLMKNIREDKGYTYGIYSNVISMRNAGYFTISAETGSDVTDKAIKEIHKEIDKLQNNLIGDEELKTVKNYMLGNSLRMIDGALAAGDFFKVLYESGLNEEYFYRYIDKIKSIDKEEIRTMAQKHLDKADFIQIIAGG